MEVRVFRISQEKSDRKSVGPSVCLHVLYVMDADGTCVKCEYWSQRQVVRNCRIFYIFTERIRLNHNK